METFTAKLIKSTNSIVEITLLQFQPNPLSNPPLSPTLLLCRQLFLRERHIIVCNLIYRFCAFINFVLVILPGKTIDFKVMCFVVESTKSITCKTQYYLIRMMDGFRYRRCLIRLRTCIFFFGL